MKLLYTLVIALFLAFPLHGATYYMSTTGSDGNDGLTLGTPWATPNHAVNCGDVVQAAVGNYSAQSISGTATCAGANNVAWLTCAIFLGCKVAITGATNGIMITSNAWGVQGWEVDATSSTGVFFGTYTAHHVIFANDVAVGGGSGGFDTGGAGADDYLIVVGCIAYNSTTSSAHCYSGIDIYEPTDRDTLPGTHIYVAGNFAWDNLNPNPCQSGTPTDGNGILFDSLNVTSYSQQIVAENNILVFNGGRGLQTNGSQAGGKTYFRHNTTALNNTDASQTTICSEIAVNNSYNTEIYLGILQTNSPTSCGGSATYPTRIYPGTSTHVYQDWEYDSQGNYSGCLGCGAFTYGPNNTTGTSAAFFNPVDPGSPSCGSFASVPACMATMIANFKPTAAGAAAYGYQIPSSASVYDPLFPQWLCNVNLPAGLVTMGCLTGSSYSGATISGGSVH